MVAVVVLLVLLVVVVVPRYQRVISSFLWQAPQQPFPPKTAPACEYCLSVQRYRKTTCEHTFLTQQYSFSSNSYVSDVAFANCKIGLLFNEWWKNAKVKLVTFCNCLGLKQADSLATNLFIKDRSSLIRCQPWHIDFISLVIVQMGKIHWLSIFII